MARGGPRKGSGRKRLGRVAMLVRVKPEIRARLERDAKRSGHSLSREAEFYLSDAIDDLSETGDRRTKDLCYLIIQLAQAAKASGGVREEGGKYKDEEEFNWRANRFDYEAFKYAIFQALEHYAPGGDAGPSRYPLGETPEELGRIMALTVFTLLRTESSELHAYAKARKASRKSLFYALPEVARDLSITPKKGE